MRRGRRQRFVVGCALLVALAGCAEGAPDVEPVAPPSFATRDSGGIRIVESSDSAWTRTEAWHVDAEPEVVIGTASGELRAPPSAASGRSFASTTAASPIRIA